MADHVDVSDPLSVPYRSGEGLQTLLLARGGISAPEFASIEEYLGRNTHDYYAALGEVGGGRWQSDAGGSSQQGRSWPSKRWPSRAEAGVRLLQCVDVARCRYRDRVSDSGSRSAGLVPVFVSRLSPADAVEAPYLASQFLADPVFGEHVEWEAKGAEPRWLAQDTSDCAAAFDPSIFHSRGADELKRFLAGAETRGETALLVATIGDLSESSSRSPLHRYDGSVSLPGFRGSIAGRRLPEGTRPVLVRQALPAYVPDVLRRARSPHFNDPELLTQQEAQAADVLDEMRARHAEEEAEAERVLGQARESAEPVRYGLLYETGDGLADAVAASAIPGLYAAGVRRHPSRSGCELAGAVRLVEERRLERHQASGLRPRSS